MKVEDTKKYVEAADAVLKNLEDHIRDTGGSREGKGNVTMSTVRKTLELAKDSKSFLEFELRFGYMVARNIDPRQRNSYLEKFHENLLKAANKDLNFLRELMKYVVMKFTVLAKL